MGKKRKKLIFLYNIELFIYILLFIAYFLLSFFDNSTMGMNFSYTVALSIVIIYHFIISNIFPRLNTIHTDRIFKKNYKEGEAEEELSEINREGDVWVIRIFILYLFGIYIGCKYHVIQWNWILAGMFLLLAFNNIFKYKKCLIKLLVYNNKINCCMDCHINGWDNILIFSVLPFSLIICNLNLLNIILVSIICFFAVSGLIMWEWTLYFHPERMMPSSNQLLTCVNCRKNFYCVGEKKNLFRDIRLVNKGKGKKGSFKDVYNQHYAAFGLIFSTVIVSLEYFLLGRDYFTKYIIFWCVIFWGMPGWQVVYNYMEREYKELFFDHIDKIIDWGEETANNCSKAIYIRFNEGMFRIHSLRNILIYLSSLLALTIAMVNILYQENTFEFPKYIDLSTNEFNINNLKFTIALFIFIFCIQIGCKAFVIFYNSYKQLQYMSYMDTKIDYFCNGYMHYNAIKSYCNKGIMIIAGVCLILIISVLNSPINFESEWRLLILIVMIAVSLCPMVILFGVHRYLKKIQIRMKRGTLDYFETNYVATAIRDNEQDIENVKKILEFRDELFSKNINTVFDRNIISFIFTLVTAIIQLLLIYKN